MLLYNIFTDHSADAAQIYMQSALPDSWQDELKRGSWFRIFLPKSLKGEQLSLPEGLDVLYRTAKINGSLGWRINLGAGAGFFAGSMSRQTAESVYGKEGAVVAGSGAVGGRATRLAMGWKISGRWDYCTGALLATAFTVNASLPNGEVRTFVLRPDQVTIHRHWPYWALKASETYAIEVSGTQVPFEYSFSIGHTNHFPDYNLYNLDFMLFARFCMAASLLGMASGFLEAFRKSINSKGAAAQLLDSHARNFEQYLSVFKNNLWNLADSSMKLARASEQRSLHSALTKLITRIKPLMEVKSLEMIRLVGMEAFSEYSELHHKWRDYMLAGQHFLYK